MRDSYGEMPHPSFECSEVTRLLDMREGYAPIRNILGMSDPNVNFIDGQWVIFIGGMGFDFKTNILRATLPVGENLQSNNWRFDMVPGSSWRAKKLIKQPPRGRWNRCMHSICYAVGVSEDRTVERIYHAGRNTESILSTTVPYKIGYLEKHGDEWVSCEQPLKIKGIVGYEGVLEPKVEYRDGYWHMRYLALTEPGDDKDGKHTILYSKSEDGVRGWSEPIVFSDAYENYYDSVSIPNPPKGYLMALTRDSNLFSKPTYPKQGIWISTSDTYTGDRHAWSEPRLVVDPELDTEGWYVNGMCSPSMHWSDAADEKGKVLYVFFVGAAERTNWFRLAAKSLMHRKLPAPPSPFYFTIGKARIVVHSVDQLE